MIFNTSSAAGMVGYLNYRYVGAWPVYPQTSTREKLTSGNSISSGTWGRPAGRNGFSPAQLLERVPGRCFSEIYSAMKIR